MIYLVIMLALAVSAGCWLWGYNCGRSVACDEQRAIGYSQGRDIGYSEGLGRRNGDRPYYDEHCEM